MAWRIKSEEPPAGGELKWPGSYSKLTYLLYHAPTPKNRIEKKKKTLILNIYIGAGCETKTQHPEKGAKMKRKKMKPKKDKRIFSQTAKKTKAINVTPKIMRGGTRL